MRPELDFNDIYVAGQRQERLGRLGQRPEEHTYLHKTLDEAVADLQVHGHYLHLAWVVWLSLLTIGVGFLLFR